MFGLSKREKFWKALRQGNASRLAEVTTSETLISVDSTGEKPLMVAIATNQPQIVEFLLEHGVSPQQRNRMNRTSLLSALDAKHMEVAEVLVSRGLDVNEPVGSDGMTALIYSVDQKNPEAVEFLLENGADVEARGGKQGHRALFWCLYSRNGSKDVLQHLLDHNAEVNSPDRNGQTPLMLAAQNGFGSLVELLIARGADVNYEDNSGQTALVLAQSLDLAEAAQILLDAGASKTLESFEEEKREIEAQKEVEWIRKAIRGGDPEIDREIEAEMKRLGS